MSKTSKYKVNCAMAQCTNWGSKTTGVLYHRFPKNEDLQRVWVLRCKRRDIFNPDNARVCSVHFRQEDYQRDLKNELLGLPQRKILCPDAVPCLRIANWHGDTVSVSSTITSSSTVTSQTEEEGLAGDVHIKEDPGKYEPFEMVFVAVKQEVKDESWNDDARVDVVASCTETTHIAETAVEGNMLVKEEITSEDSEVCQESTDIPTDARSPSPSSDSSTDADKSNVGLGTKTHVWTQEDMCRALDALRHHELSLSRASAKYGIPSTTLWQRAHREGIDTPKKEGYFKSWTDENMKNALEMMRTGAMSANKASKVYSIPSSTLYKIARREGIRLSAPFNAAPTAWTPDDLERALEAIRKGEISVQRASAEFGIPTGTLYGRCKRGGIELSTRGNITAWTEECMGKAMEAVRVDGMSINMASQQYSVPYSSLYGRLRRCKCESDGQQQEEETSRSPPSAAPQDTVVPDLQENVLQDASPQLDALPPSTQVLCASPT